MYSAQITSFCRQGGSERERSEPGIRNEVRNEQESGHTSSSSGGSGGNQTSDGRFNGKNRGQSFGQKGSRKTRDRSKTQVGRKKKRRSVAFTSDVPTSLPSTACLAEVLAFFGFVFEGTGAATKPSVAEAFAMLRLHTQPAETREAGSATLRSAILPSSFCVVLQSPM